MHSGTGTSGMTCCGIAYVWGSAFLDKSDILKTCGGKNIPGSDLSGKRRIWGLRAVKTRPVVIFL